MQMLTDNAVTKNQDDKFGFSPYAEILAKTIKDTDDLPFCIGIFAEWGAGKSSLMNMIRDHLDQQQNLKSVWFNPWKYDKKEDLWNALIQSVLYRIIEDTNDDKIIKNAKILAKSTAWLMLKKGISSATAGFISDEHLESVVDKFSKTDELHYKHINHFEENFAKVVSDYTNGGKLVIFVDDLDRCMPENAITVLESLKLFIGDANCVFVLGMDQVVVEQGLELRFPKNLEITGRDYLDKIVQVPFFLPPVPFNKLKSAMQLSKTVDFDDQIWKLIELGLGGNPRKTKRFINSSYLANAILHNRSIGEVEFASDEIVYMSDEMQRFYIAKLLIFQMAFSDFYHFIRLNHGAWYTYSQELIGGIGFDEIQRVLDKQPNLKVFWEDARLRQFMKETEKPEFFAPPTATQLRPIIQAISIVSSDTTETKVTKK